MTDQKQSNRVICLGGLDSSQNYLSLSENKPGSATRLINYEVGLSGGYRRINGYQPYDLTYAEVNSTLAEGKILGVMIFPNSVTGVINIFAARKLKASSAYGLFKFTAGLGWIQVTLPATRSVTAVVKLRHDVGNNGVRNFLAIVDGINKALLFDGSTWAEIDAADTGADLAHAGGNQVIDAPSLVRFFSHTLFLGRDNPNSFKGILTYSAPDKFFDFTAANGGGQMIPGFEIVQIKAFRDFLYVFGTNAIKKAKPDVTAGFLLEDVTANLGCVATDSVIEIGGDLIFLGPDGFRPVTGTDKIGDVQLETISKDVQELLRNRLSGLDADAVNSVVIRTKSQFRVFFSSENFDVTNAEGVIGGLRTADTLNGWEFGELRGIRASCADSRIYGTEEFVLHGDYDGKVYRQESGNTFNGRPVTSVYSTPYLDFGDTEVRKVWEKITLFLKGEGAVEMSIALEFDWGASYVVNPNSYPFDILASALNYGDGSTFGGGFLYGGAIKPLVVTDVQGSFFSTRINIITSGPDAPFSIHGMVCEYAVKGRR